MLEKDILLKQLGREKKARKEAENIVETKSRVLYKKNLDLIEKEHQTRVLFEELKRQERSLSIRHEILEIMMKYPSLDEEVATKILRIICETLHLAEGALWKVNSIKDKLQCICTWSVEDKKLEKFAEISKEILFPIGVGLPGQVWQEKSVIWIKDVVLDSNFPRAKYAKEAGLYSAFALPISYEEDVLGVLEFFNKDFYPFDNYLEDMLNDISNQIGIFIEREESQKKILSLSRLAGMAEVASNVLHNVGNILNSVNISSEVIYEKIKHSEMENLALLSELVQTHKNDLASFIANDPKGQNLPDFLLLLSNEWTKEKTYLNNEIITLIKNLDHIRNVIVTPQSLGQSFGLVTEVDVKSILEEALFINKINYERAGIEVIFEFLHVKKVTIDRAKLFQILVNLIKNSIEALLESGQHPKQIILCLKEKNSDYFVIQVSDNGVGILPENLNSIFSHGFTTKKTGHGFGLHSCAIYAKELGGDLHAESKGINFGATFTLELPFIFGGK